MDIKQIDEKDKIRIFEEQFYSEKGRNYYDDIAGEREFTAEEEERYNFYDGLYWDSNAKIEKYGLDMDYFKWKISYKKYEYDIDKQQMPIGLVMNQLRDCPNADTVLAGLLEMAIDHPFDSASFDFHPVAPFEDDKEPLTDWEKEALEENAAKIAEALGKVVVRDQECGVKGIYPLTEWVTYGGTKIGCRFNRQIDIKYLADQLAEFQRMTCTNTQM